MMRKLHFILLLSLVAPLLTKAQDSVYVFVHTGIGSSGKPILQFSKSANGFTWTKSAVQANLTSTLGDSGIYAPSVIRDSAGTFHMVFGIGQQAKGFGYATSRDMVNWSTPIYIGIMDTVPGIQSVAAPDLWYDAARRRYQVVFSASVQGRNELTVGKTQPGKNYGLYATTTTDFKNWRPANVMVREAEISMTDATMLKLGRYHYLFMTNANTEPSSEAAISSSTSVFPTGPYGQASDPVHGSFLASEPTIVKVGNEWFMYFVKNRAKTMGLLRSKDLTTWADFSTQVSFEQLVGQGSVHKLLATGW